MIILTRGHNEFIPLEIYPWVDETDNPRDIDSAVSIKVDHDGMVHRGPNKIKPDALLKEAKGLIDAHRVIEAHLEGGDHIVNDESVRKQLDPKYIQETYHDVCMSWEMLAPKLGITGKKTWLEHAMRNSNSPEIWNQLGLPKGTLGRINDRADRLEGRLDRQSFYTAVFEEFNILLKAIDLMGGKAYMPVVDIILDWITKRPEIEQGIPMVCRLIEDREIERLSKMMGWKLHYGDDYELAQGIWYYENLNQAEYLEEVHRQVAKIGGASSDR